MRKDYFVFGSVASNDYGVWLSGPRTADAPQRDVELVSVPGRSGSLLIDNGRYMDIRIAYTCAITHGFEARFASFRNALLSQRGYRRLEDTIHPEEYRLATLIGPIQPNTTPYNRAGEFDLEFTCKPQRFLRVGERTIHIAKTGTLIRNPGMPSRPLITIYGKGAGTITVGGVTVTLKDTFTGLTLDCDTMDAYMLAANKNADILAPTFPEIPSGESVVSWTDGVTGMDIVPRWWTL